MRNQDINIRDPFILPENGKYYMYGTRAASFGFGTAGFDVYVSDDLETWSDPIPVFDSAACGRNKGVNWAPEVHKYGGAYYMFATFTQNNGLRGTYIMKADAPTGPFLPHSDGAVTPDGWEPRTHPDHQRHGLLRAAVCRFENSRRRSRHAVFGAVSVLY